MPNSFKKYYWFEANSKKKKKEKEYKVAEAKCLVAFPLGFIIGHGVMSFLHSISSY